jgi:CRISPR-associated protein Cmr1
MGGFACDPTDEGRCGFNEAAYAGSGNVADGLRDVCAACRVFGCTGWSAKFRIVIADTRGRYEVDLSRVPTDFQLQLIETKSLADEERWLLAKTFWLIAHYGSLGGKTTLKPPAQPDYGLVQLVKNLPAPNLTREPVAKYLQGLTAASADLARRAQSLSPEVPTLRLFYFNPSMWLEARQMNDLVKTDPSGFLAGRRGVSKKVFSFQSVKRFWGYARDAVMLQAILKKLTALGVQNTRTGQEVLNEL